MTLVGQGGCNLYQSPASTDIAKVVTCIDPRLTVLQPGEVQALYLPIVCPRPARIVRPFEFQHHLLDHGLLAAYVSAFHIYFVPDGTLPPRFDTQIGPDTLSKLATLLDIGQEPNTANTSLDYYVFPVEDFEPRRGNVREQRAATCSVDTKEKEKVAQTLQDRLFTSAFLSHLFEPCLH